MSEKTVKKEEHTLRLGGGDHVVFKENEIEANRIMAVSALVSVLVFLVVWIFSECGVFTVYYLGQSEVIYGSIIFLLVSGPVISRMGRREAYWVKYLLMGIIILAFSVASSVFTYNVPVLLMIPPVLSVRYFSGRYTSIISVVCLGFMTLTTVVGAFFGDLDLNSLELPQGTVIDLGEETWLYDAVIQQKFSYDRMLYLYDVFLYSYLVRLLQFLIISAASIAMAIQGRRLIFRQRDLTESSARIAADLSVAARIQADELPSVFPGGQEFDLCASMTPAREVGGDFYDCFLLDEDHLYFVIADVSGKGIPAAMFMMASKNILAEHARMGKRPAKILEEANKTLCINNRENMFVTVWLGILEISTGRLTAASAGHDSPVMQEAKQPYAFWEEENGFPLGWFDTSTYQDFERSLQPGAKLFCYTDGVTDAMDPEGQMFGSERLLQALNARQESGAQKILDLVRESVDAFVGEAERFDDLTMLCVEYLGQQ